MYKRLYLASKKENHAPFILSNVCVFIKSNEVTLLFPKKENILTLLEEGLEFASNNEEEYLISLPVEEAHKLILHAC